MSISPTGSLATRGGTGINTLSVTPSATKDVLVLWITSQDPPSGVGVTGVSGGGITTWKRLSSYFDTDTTSFVDEWWGVITATGSSTVTMTGLPGTTEFSVFAAQQFTESNAGWLWSQFGAGSPAAGASGHSLGSGLNVSWPSRTASGSGDSLYVGNGMSVFGTLNAGSSSGYTYPFTGFSSNRPVYNQSFSGTGNPTSTQTNTGAYDTIGAVLNAAPPSSLLIASGIC